MSHKYVEKYVEYHLFYGADRCNKT